MVDQDRLVTYLNGEIIPHRQAVAALQEKNVPPESGIYDTERTFNGQLFKLGAHLERLYRGLKLAQIDPGITRTEIEVITQDILEANRPLLGPRDEFIVTQVVSTSPINASEVNVVVHCQLLDFTAFARSYVQGVRVITPVTYGVPRQDNAQDGAQQILTLMTSTEGSITECTGANFMFVRGGRIKLPDRHNVLPGVSMQTVLDLADSQAIAVDEDDYATADVYESDEAFVSSTRYCMLPVATLNGLSLGEELPGPLTRRLLDAWRNMIGVDFVQRALDHLPDIPPSAGPNRS